MTDATITRQPVRARIWKAISSNLITPAEASIVSGSSLLTVLSFPDFDLWFLAWLSIAPLLIVVARAQKAGRGFVAGWLWGTIFFYGTCWWLTHPMIHYARFPNWIAYPLLLLPVALVAIFPALCCAFLARLVSRFGPNALLFTPIVWVSFEWVRYLVTGQLWNAIGYSQAFHLLTIQSARWGGVYAVGFLLVSANAAIALPIVDRRRPRLIVSAIVFAALVSYIGYSRLRVTNHNFAGRGVVIAVQPNVPIDLTGDTSQMKMLLERHLSLSKVELDKQESKPPAVNPQLVVWPESPMNFSYSRDPNLRQVVGDFARAHETSVLFNSLEPAKDGGSQNSAVLVNEKGEMSARYDKIRLMPFGEYVPLPRWLPGASSVRGLVGEFKPGNSYTLMPLGALRAGVFICIEAAHPSIARAFTNRGADVLINISNDGYLGPTPVMRQHLANAIFRAVENDRDLVRVTNTGITAFISSNGAVQDPTTGFHEDVRTWTISRGGDGSTFYSRHGDVFVYGCGLISLGFISASFVRRRVV